MVECDHGVSHVSGRPINITPYLLIFTGYNLFRLYYPKKQKIPAMPISEEPVKTISYDFPMEGEFFILDTETNALPRDNNDGTTWWPLPMQIAWILTDRYQNSIEGRQYTLRQRKIRTINKQALKKHGITKKIMMQEGRDPVEVYHKLLDALKRTKYVVSHGADFHINVIKRDMSRNGLGEAIDVISCKPVVCTQIAARDFCAIPSDEYNALMSDEYKGPSKGKLYEQCFGKRPETGKKGAYGHTEIIFKCFFELMRLGVIKVC